MMMQKEPNLGIFQPQTGMGMSDPQRMMLMQMGVGMLSPQQQVPLQLAQHLRGFNFLSGPGLPRDMGPRIGR